METLWLLFLQNRRNHARYTSFKTSHINAFLKSGYLQETIDLQDMTCYEIRVIKEVDEDHIRQS